MSNQPRTDASAGDPSPPNDIAAAETNTTSPRLTSSSLSPTAAVYTPAVLIAAVGGLRSSPTGADDDQHDGDASPVFQDVDSDDEWVAAADEAILPHDGGPRSFAPAAPLSLTSDDMARVPELVDSDTLEDPDNPEPVSRRVTPASAAPGAAGFGPASSDGQFTLSVRIEALRSAGNEAFSDKRFEDAISSYTACLKLVTQPEEEAALRSNRSAAFASLCQQYRTRPAVRSEHVALFGMDPMHLADLALKDSRRAVQLRPLCTEALCRQGSALFLLERYSEAEEAYLSGLSQDPTNGALQEGLRQVTAATAEQDKPVIKRQRTLGKQAVDDLECILCFKLLFEPVTTPCGHSFCRSCFCRALDHSNKCPLCRTVLHIGRDLPITQTLATVLEKAFPEEYAERRAEELGEAVSSASVTAAQAFHLPLFVMTIMLPGEKMALNVFEPRYRLMARRCMEGNRRFGMAQVRGPGGQLEDVACEAEILECQPLPDGRYYIELIGRRRVRLGETWELDGYRMAKATPLSDDPPAANSEQQAELATLTQEVDAMSNTWVERLRHFAERSGRPERLRDLLDKAGPKPQPSQPEALSFWVASLMVNFLPQLNGGDKLQIMRSTTTVERLLWVRGLLGGRTAENASPCCVM